MLLRGMSSRKENTYPSSMLGMESTDPAQVGWLQARLLPWNVNVANSLRAKMLQAQPNGAEVQAELTGTSLALTSNPLMSVPRLLLCLCRSCHS